MSDMCRFNTEPFRLKTMEGHVVGVCVKIDGHLSFLACPYCYAHLCQSYQHFNGIGALQESLETDSSSSSEIEQLDDAAVFGSLNSIAGSFYAQVKVTNNMWASCSAFRELDEAMVDGRKFGKVKHFRRLTDELFWDVPAGLIVVNVGREKSILFKSGQEPASISVCSALTYLRRWAGMGLIMFEQNKIAFLECHFSPGSIHTSILRLMRLTVESWNR